MAKIVIVNERICKFLEAGAQAYRPFVRGDITGALELYIDLIVSEYVVRRLSALIPREQLETLIEDPEKLYAFAIDLLGKRFTEFEEGAPADGSWTRE